MFKGIGTCTSIFGHRNLLTPERIKYLKDSGMEYIEISALQTLHFDMHNKRHVESIAKAIKKNKIKVWSFHAPFTPIAMMDEPTRKEGIQLIVEACSLQELFGFEVIVMHQGSDDPKGEKKKEIANFRKSMKEIVKRTGKTKLALETTGHYRPKPSDVLMDVLSDFDDKKVGICVDTGHVRLAEDVAPAIYKFGKRIYSVHIQDNDGRSDLHMLPFSGVIKWNEVFKALKDVGYSGVFMYEGADPGKNTKENMIKMKMVYKKAISM